MIDGLPADGPSYIITVMIFAVFVAAFMWGAMAIAFKILKRNGDE